MTVLALKKPRHPPASELRRKYREDSNITVTFGDSGIFHLDGSYAPDFLEIEFSGPIARIPSLKNWKMPGCNFANPDVTARLMVMTDLWMAATASKKINYGKEELYCLVILAKRSRTFDEDNGFASVKDWLEPMVKAKHNRRWGIGIVDNDYHVAGQAIHSYKLGAESKTTRIIIRPFELVRKHVLTFAAGMMI